MDNSNDNTKNNQKGKYNKIICVCSGVAVFIIITVFLVLTLVPWSKIEVSNYYKTEIEPKNQNFDNNYNDLKDVLATLRSISDMPKDLWSGNAWNDFHNAQSDFDSKISIFRTTIEKIKLDYDKLLEKDYIKNNSEIESLSNKINDEINTLLKNIRADAILSNAATLCPIQDPVAVDLFWIEQNVDICSKNIKLDTNDSNEDFTIYSKTTRNMLSNYITYSDGLTSIASSKNVSQYAELIEIILTQYYEYIKVRFAQILEQVENVQTDISQLRDKLQ